MSMPVKYCFLVSAADDSESFAKLHPAMKRNLDGGHFTVFPCDHDPPCRQMTYEEYDSLMQRFKQLLTPPGDSDERAARTRQATGRE